MLVIDADPQGSVSQGFFGSAAVEELARGGAEAWAKVRTLVTRGNYATFSTNAPYTESFQRQEDGNLYRLDPDGTVTGLTFRLAGDTHTATKVE